METSPDRISLDDLLDSRWEALDRQASDWAEMAGGVERGEPNVALLNALKLRYYGVKLLRWATVCQAWVPELPGGVTWHGARNRDEDYADVLQSICQFYHRPCSLHWHDLPPAVKHSPPPNPWWRRWAGKGWSWGQKLAGKEKRIVGKPRFLLCGNPQWLGHVADGLQQEGAEIGWLYDRFAFRAAWDAVKQNRRLFFCDSSTGSKHRVPMPQSAPLDFQGVDLSGVLLRWLEQRAALVGANQAKLIEQIDRHLHAWRPDLLVLDEDATPMARGAIYLGRKYGIRSVVLQHGVPFVRFGFAPMLADCVAVWGEASKQQLIGWGVPGDRIVVTGCPKHDCLIRISSSPSHPRPRLLLLCTVPPTADRPDSLEFHLTPRTHRRLLHAACSAAQQLQADLLIKAHPRAPHDTALTEALADFPTLRWQRVQGDLSKWVAQSDVVLSCASSSGIEAALCGGKVIQLMPEGAADLIPALSWGLLATAHNADELLPLLKHAISQSPPPPFPAASLSVESPSLPRVLQLLRSMAS